MFDFLFKKKFELSKKREYKIDTLKTYFVGSHVDKREKYIREIQEYLSKVEDLLNEAANKGEKYIYYSDPRLLIFGYLNSFLNSLERNNHFGCLESKPNTIVNIKICYRDSRRLQKIRKPIESENK